MENRIYDYEDYATGPLNMLLGEKVQIEKILKLTGAHKKMSAKILGISENTLTTKIYRHSINIKDYA